MFFKVRRSKLFWTLSCLLLFLNIGLIYLLISLIVENMILQEGTIPLLIGFFLMVGAIDVFYYKFVSIKNYAIMVNDTFYYCGKNIFDGAQVLKERKLKKAYLPYASGDKETVYLNKTTPHDLLFGVFSTPGGNKIVVFYYMEKDFDFINSDEKLNNDNIVSKYPLDHEEELYRIVKLENEKYAIQRFYTEWHYYGDKIKELSLKSEQIEDKHFIYAMSDEYDTEEEALEDLEYLRDE